MRVDIESVVSVGNVRIDENDVEDLAASIDRIGLLQPVVVAAEEDGVYVLIDGHRRFAAHKLLERKDIEVVLNDVVQTAGDRITAQYAANVFRKDLSAYEKAQVALDLKAEGMKQAEVAAELGLTAKEVSKYQRAARTIATLPNAESAVALSEQGMFELVEEFTNPTTQWGDPAEEPYESLVLENALRLIVTGESHSVRSALGGAEREANETKILEHLEPMVKDIYDRGGEMSDFDEINGIRGSQQIARHQKTTNFGSQLQFDQKQVEAHRDQDCHRYTMVTGGYSGTYLAEWCVKPAAHEAKGKSELKVDDADEAYDRKLAEKQERADAKAAKLDRFDDVAAALESFTIKDFNLHGLVVELRISSDAARAACKALGLEAEKSEYGGYPMHAEAVEKWIGTLPDSKQLYAYALVILGGDYINGFGAQKPRTTAFFEGRGSE